VTVRVLEVKLDKKQIALTMKSERGAERGRAPTKEGGAGARAVGGAGKPTAADAPRAAPSGPKTPFNNPFGALGKLR
jgi:hypothetical protein